MAADLHTHTKASWDSEITIQDRLSLARKQGIDTVALTDHMAVHDWLDDRNQSVNDLMVITGVELNCTIQGTRIDIIGYFVDPDRMRERVSDLSVKDGKNLEAVKAISWVHADGGAAVLAHPGRYDVDLTVMTNELVDVGLDGIEITYPYDQYTFAHSETPEMPKTPVDRIEAIATSHDLVQTGGSDCHGGEKTYMGTVRIDDNRVEELEQASLAYR